MACGYRASMHNFLQHAFVVLLLSNGATGNRSTETDDRISSCTVLFSLSNKDVLYPEAEEIPASISRAFIFTEAQPRWIWRGKYSAGISEAEGYKVLIPAENRCRGYGCVKFTVQSELSQLKTGAGVRMCKIHCPKWIIPAENRSGGTEGVRILSIVKPLTDM